MAETERRLIKSRSDAQTAYLEFALTLGFRVRSAETLADAEKDLRSELAQVRAMLDEPVDLEAYAAVTPTEVLVRELVQRAKRAILGAPSRLFVHKRA